MLIGFGYRTINFQMKRAFVLTRFFALVTLAILCFSSAAWASSIVVDNDLDIYSYPVPSASQQVFSSNLEENLYGTVSGMAVDNATKQLLVAEIGLSEGNSGADLDVPARGRGAHGL